MNQIIKSISISIDTTILEALKKMDAAKRKLLIVTKDDSIFCGLLSIGDIQRAIIKGVVISEPIVKIIREDITVASNTDDIEELKARMRARRNEFMPIVDAENKVVKVLFWEDLFEQKIIKKELNLPVVIMAGGKGTRLKPLTNVIPKPLIPIHKKTIIEDIMDRFVDFGCNDFYLSVNYKADMIKYYLQELNNPQYNLAYFQEAKPLGTAGSLTLLKDKINQTFFVSNCDILVDDSYEEILKYHKEHQNEITIVAALKDFSIPYGTLETSEEGFLTSISEKPNFNFKINTGMYIVEPHLLDEIPQDTFYHITHLIEKIISRSGKVGVFPITEGSWSDIGTWNEYLNAIVR